MSNPALSYETYMVPALFERALPPLLSLARPMPGERVLDLACGTGIVARTVAAQVGDSGEVTGLDINPLMLEVAQAQVSQDGLDIDWVESSAESLPFADGSFDLVLCQQGLQFCTDRDVAIAEIQRVLGDEGRLVASVWKSLEEHPVYREFDEVLETVLGVQEGPGEPFSLGNIDQLRAMLEKGGFHNIEIKEETVIAKFPDPDKWFAMMLATVAAVIPEYRDLDQQARDEAAESVRAAMSDTIAEHIVDENVVVPFHGIFVRAAR